MPHSLGPKPIKRAHHRADFDSSEATSVRQVLDGDLSACPAQAGSPLALLKKARLADGCESGRGLPHSKALRVLIGHHRQAAA
jgi:hypothetical protein